MSGHAAPEELREIETREAELDPATSPVADLLELGLLYLEPAHREEDAIRLFESILARDPDHGPARLWLAYSLLHYAMDQPSLARAQDLLTPLLDAGTYGGAAHMLLAEVRDEQGADVGERIRLLEASVAQEPDWVSNRHDLAWAYSAAGRHDAAAEQLEQALEAIRAEDPSWTAAERSYDQSITGRTEFGAEERLRADLRQLT